MCWVIIGALEWVGKQIVACVTCQCGKEEEKDADSTGQTKTKAQRQEQQRRKDEDRAYRQLNDHESYGWG